MWWFLCFSTVFPSFQAQNKTKQKEKNKREDGAGQWTPYYRALHRLTWVLMKSAIFYGETSGGRPVPVFLMGMAHLEIISQLLPTPALGVIMAGEAKQKLEVYWLLKVLPTVTGAHSIQLSILIPVDSQGLIPNISEIFSPPRLDIFRHSLFWYSVRLLQE